MKIINTENKKLKNTVEDGKIFPCLWISIGKFVKLATVSKVIDRFDVYPNKI